MSLQDSTETILFDIKRTAMWVYAADKYLRQFNAGWHGSSMCGPSAASTSSPRLRAESVYLWTNVLSCLQNSWPSLTMRSNAEKGFPDGNNEALVV